MTNAKLRYFALLNPETMSGRSLPYWREEERSCRKELGTQIVGDFATEDEAKAHVRAQLRQLVAYKGPAP